MGDIAFTPEDFIRKMDRFGITEVIVWDDIGYWMHKRPRRRDPWALDKWAHFVRWCFNE